MATLQDQKVLQAARRHEVSSLRTFLRETSASVQDQDTLSSPLHQAVLGAKDRLETGHHDEISHEDNTASSEEFRASIMEAAQSTMQLLLEKGAIWNDLDKKNETPGCLALRLEFRELYDIMVDAGVRAEMLLNRLDEYEALDDDDEEVEEAEPDVEANDNGHDIAPEENQAPATAHSESSAEGTHRPAEPDLQNEAYLKSSLRIEQHRIIDGSDNGVMMEWETELMQRHVELLSPQSKLRVLNVGFGMGIIDEAFQRKLPSSYHIIEAHPAVLEQIKAKGWHDKPHVTIHEGRWQDIVPQLLEQGDLFDAIYFDTFAEDYKEFRNFFSEHLFGLLDDQGKWSFFNGLGADRQISYDVYSKVVEMDLFEAGFDVEWETAQVPEMDDKIWDGVKRKYWSLKHYKLPTCRFLS